MFSQWVFEPIGTTIISRKSACFPVKHVGVRCWGGNLRGRLIRSCKNVCTSILSQSASFHQINAQTHTPVVCMHSCFFILIHVRSPMISTFTQHDRWAFQHNDNFFVINSKISLSISSWDNLREETQESPLSKLFTWAYSEMLMSTSFSALYFLQVSCYCCMSEKPLHTTPIEQIIQNYTITN